MAVVKVRDYPIQRVPGPNNHPHAGYAPEVSHVQRVGDEPRVFDDQLLPAAHEWPGVVDEFTTGFRKEFRVGGVAAIARKDIPAVPLWGKSHEVALLPREIPRIGLAVWVPPQHRDKRRGASFSKADDRSTDAKVTITWSGHVTQTALLITELVRELCYTCLEQLVLGVPRGLYILCSSVRGPGR